MLTNLLGRRILVKEGWRVSGKGTVVSTPPAKKYTFTGTVVAVIPVPAGDRGPPDLWFSTEEADDDWEKGQLVYITHWVGLVLLEGGTIFGPYR